jgi:hypothetical protein
MNSKLLIDAIVRQTTVLIAQLSTAAGIRAPLAHVADQVFLELSRELEAQGLGKRVVANMFGMLILGYQKKVQRLTESASVRDKSLWEAVLEFISAQPGVSRERVLDRFSRDDDEAVGSVLRDLGSSGLVFASGQGRNIVYRPTTEADRRALFDGASEESLVPMLWATIPGRPQMNRRAHPTDSCVNTRDRPLRSKPFAARDSGRTPRSCPQASVRSSSPTPIQRAPRRPRLRSQRSCAYTTVTGRVAPCPMHPRRARRLGRRVPKSPQESTAGSSPISERVRSRPAPSAANAIQRPNARATGSA